MRLVAPAAQGLTERGGLTTKLHLACLDHSLGAQAGLVDRRW
jgi:hypothetical protein